MARFSVLSGNRPSSLGDNDWLSLGSSSGDLESCVEERRGVLDGVILSDLEVWEGVHAEEIGLINNGRVGAVSPDIPGINVSDCHLGQRSAGKSLSNLLNVADDLCWSSSNSGWVVLETSWRDTVKILRSNRDAVDTACELLAVLLDGRCKGSNLVVDDCLTC